MLPDLNLLRVFDAIWQEHSLTRAAARLHLTQPAVSNALRRLREHLGDDLFQRGPDGMVPTATAATMAPHVRAALEAVDTAFNAGKPFDPCTATERLVLAVSDQAEVALGSPLLSALRRQAPGMQVLFRHIGRDDVTEELDNQRAMLALGVLPEPPSRMTRIRLYRDPLMMLVRPGHPLLAAEDRMAAYLALPHILLSPVGDLHGAVDRMLAQMGHSRQVAVVVAHMASAAIMTAQEDLIWSLPDRAARLWEQHMGLIRLPVPFEPEGAPLSMVFHRRFETYPPHQWLRRLIVSVARGEDTGEGEQQV